jgi:hypothetical protein
MAALGPKEVFWDHFERAVAQHSLAPINEFIAKFNQEKSTELYAQGRVGSPLLKFKANQDLLIEALDKIFKACPQITRVSFTNHALYPNKVSAKFIEELGRTIGESKATLVSFQHCQLQKDTTKLLISLFKKTDTLAQLNISGNDFSEYVKDVAWAFSHRNNEKPLDLQVGTSIDSPIKFAEFVDRVALFSGTTHVRKMPIADQDPLSSFNNKLQQVTAKSNSASKFSIKKATQPKPVAILSKPIPHLSHHKLERAAISSAELEKVEQFREKYIAYKLAQQRASFDQFIKLLENSNGKPFSPADLAILDKNIGDAALFLPSVAKTNLVEHAISTDRLRKAFSKATSNRP